ncbi:MAG: hypothetical protein H6819_04800 [Phycisphaerales bacterium]|nr:hypothetical protein [Phycisphaerales bacterium]MCB9856519.1 hypothetical protein [Phycisphaerales bacterium]MCB9864000.1 hypothetical protein [Phycisphaerales bacterium]
MKRRMRIYRWRMKILLPLAAFPLLQAATCTANDIAGAVIGQVATGTFQLFVGAVNSTILQLLPEADVIQILLGGNRSPFFP